MKPPRAAGAAPPRPRAVPAGTGTHLTSPHLTAAPVLGGAPRAASYGPRGGSGSGSGPPASQPLPQRARPPESPAPAPRPEEGAAGRARLRHTHAHTHTRTRSRTPRHRPPGPFAWLRASPEQPGRGGRGGGEAGGTLTRAVAPAHGAAQQEGACEQTDRQMDGRRIGSGRSTALRLPRHPRYAPRRRAASGMVTGWDGTGGERRGEERSPHRHRQSRPAPALNPDPGARAPGRDGAAGLGWAGRAGQGRAGPGGCRRAAPAASCLRPGTPGQVGG